MYPWLAMQVTFVGASLLAILTQEHRQQAGSYTLGTVQFSATRNLTT
jgi:hypothetical protein